MNPVAAEHPADVLADAIAHTPACVGIDPDVERLPRRVREGSADHVAQIREFCLGAIDAAAGVVRIVKPQSACFERFGSRGFGVLEEVCGRARERGLCVVLDAKRGDIGVSARHYAACAVDLGAQWITVNPYLGLDTLEPYLDAGLGIFALVRTSNAGSDDIQTARVVSGDTVSMMIGRQLARLGAGWIGQRGLSAVGAVVGATKTAGDEGAELREVMRDQPMLIPGFGAQGGTMEDIKPLRRARGRNPGVVVNASRSVLYPGGNDEDWQGAIRRAAESLVIDLVGLGD
ncbi:MAG: orotidine-5'-phosphate decarboxylase [Phycisphaeraceae bacterium]|nr:orotidine-5'-phosphate decarboxylase [Phycisphaeraceae bacterium]MCW5763158.1 orotidine-5'-phosphate decarboxylase [Phycisphaeraceae bacterium]